MNLRGRNFITTQDFSVAELNHLVDTATRFKQEGSPKLLEGKAVAMVFFNPSLRTRTSFEIGVHQMGGIATNLDVGQTTWTLEYEEGAVMTGDREEHIQDAAKVLSRYACAIGIRSFPEGVAWEEDRHDQVVRAFARYADVPVINIESAMYHPCQSLGDTMTMKEVFGDLAKKKILVTWTYHPDAQPMAVANSVVTTASQFGMDITLAHPPEYALDYEILTDIEKNVRASGGKIHATSDLSKAYDGVDVVYARSWGSKEFYGKPEEEQQARRSLTDWIVDERKMKQTNHAKFMHCLPVRRNVEATDAVIDSADSILYDQAENRLHIQKAILANIV